MPVRPQSALSRRGFLGLGAGIGAAVLLGGCGDDDTATATAAASAGASAASSEPVVVRTCVYAKNHASAPLYWQQFAPPNYTIEVTPVTGATQIQDALEGGQLDFGLLGPYSTIIAASDKKITSRIVGMTARNGVGLIGAKGSVESVGDLRGKKIGVPPPGIQVLILNELLTKNGLVLGKDVQGVPLAYADHVAALERGDIDAYIGTEPLCTQSVVSGKGVRLTEVADTRVGNFNTANWASSKILAERPDVVREVVKMQKAAAEFLSPGGTNDRAHWKELLVTQFGYQEPVYEAVLENVGAEWRFDDVRAGQVEGAGAMLLEQGGITVEPDYESLFAREYWDA
ncbi:MAG: Twin-arginine translocation pathway signal [Frankiales bacterium]|nr:Twin-arginine translocation pathway signal [Frankiales bacterium]